MKIYVVSNTRTGVTNELTYEVRKDDSTPVSGNIVQGFSGDDVDAIKARAFQIAKEYEAALTVESELAAQIGEHAIAGSTNKIAIQAVTRPAGQAQVNVTFAVKNAGGSIIYGPTVKVISNCAGMTWQRLKNEVQQFNEKLENAMASETVFAGATGNEISVV